MTDPLNKISKLTTNSFTKCGSLVGHENSNLCVVFFYIPTDKINFNEYNNKRWKVNLYAVNLITGNNNQLINLSNRFPYTINGSMIVLYRGGVPCSIINYKGKSAESVESEILNLSSCSFSNFMCN
jgi:hypothetical protein